MCRRVALGTTMNDAQSGSACHFYGECGPLLDFAGFPGADCFVSVSMGEMADLAAANIAARAAESIALHGRFNFLATGGETARLVYGNLLRHGALWNCWHVYLTDERCVSVKSAARNDRMIHMELLDQVPIPALQVHGIAAELGAVAGAASYTGALDSIGQFDLALLSLGEDGHVASLFPGMKNEGESAIPVLGAPKAPCERVSVSSRVLSRTRRIVVIAGGEAKRTAVAQLRHPDAFFWRIIGSSPRVVFYFDRDAIPVRE